MAVSAVSCEASAVRRVFHGVSIAEEIAKIEDTVEATSKPVPLVADPNARPTLMNPPVARKPRTRHGGQKTVRRPSA